MGARTVTAAEVARTLKRVAGMLELGVTRSVAQISGHSARIGAAQDLTAAGSALPESLAAGGWKSPQMPAHYATKISPRVGAMQRMLSNVAVPEGE